MIRYKAWPIRKKLLLNMIVFSVVPVLLVTVVALNITYKTMREQLISDYSMSGVWLKERLEQMVQEYTARFYEFEVDRELKDDIGDWYASGQPLDYEQQWRLISALNATISMESSIRSIELFNLRSGQVLMAERSGARLEDGTARLEALRGRDRSRQTNIVFHREGSELLVAHQITRFEDKAPMALMMIHVRPEKLQRILSDIKSTDQESIIVLDDQDALLEAHWGQEGALDYTQLMEELRLKGNLQRGDFWFYQEVAGGKMQVLISVPNRNLVSALSTTLLSGLLVSIFALVLAVVSSILYSRAISRPIAELSEQMRNFTLKDKAYVLPDAQTEEIGILKESFRVMVTRNQELIASEYQVRIEKRNAQIRALQAQINPHFMYNTLQVIGGMALSRGVGEINEVTVAMSDILRYSLNFAKEMVPLRQELNYLKSYLFIQNQRFDQRIDLKMQFAPRVLDCLIPKLILQPLIENSFEHGLTDREGQWQISIGGEILENGDLLLTVCDNGIGIEGWRLEQIRDELGRDAERALGTSSHIGLCNVNSRIRLRHPGEEYGLRIESAYQAGTTVRVRLKTEYEDKQDDKEQV